MSANRTKAIERRERIRKLLAQGLSDSVIAERTGYSRRNVRKIRGEFGVVAQGRATCGRGDPGPRGMAGVRGVGSVEEVASR